MSNEYDLPSRNEWLGEKDRNHYIPGWYTRHTELELNLEVKHNGVPQGMKIRDVFPWRRFAIDSDGNTIPQNTFEEQYRRYQDGFKNPETFDPRNEPMPAVLYFVRAKRGENGNLVDFAYQDDGTVVKQAKFTQDGTIAPEWLEKNKEQGDKLLRIEQLNELLADGTIDEETFIAKTRALMGSGLPIVSVKMETGEEAPKKRGRPKGSGAKTEEQLEAARARMANARAAAAAKRANPAGYVGQAAE